MANIKKAPIKFTPYFKSVLWGGDNIYKYKSIPKTDRNIGESWEISAIENRESIVSEGDYAGKYLSELTELFGEEILGRKIIEKYGNKFPLLIKFIDARENLSVQVHPDDKLAGLLHGDIGKSEMWYIIKAEADSMIISGFSSEVTREEFKRRVRDNTLIEILDHHSSNAGDIFYIPSGRVHSIGRGNFLVEIQQSSDITYRIYDYNRIDSSGNKRELHYEMAVEAIDFNNQKYSEINVLKGEKITKLVECPHFTTNKIVVDGLLEFYTSPDSFSALICIDGQVKVKAEEGEAQISEGHSILLPSVVSKVLLSGEATLLEVHI